MLSRISEKEIPQNACEIPDIGTGIPGGEEQEENTCSLRLQVLLMCISSMLLCYFCSVYFAKYIYFVILMFMHIAEKDNASLSNKVVLWCDF